METNQTILTPTTTINTPHQDTPTTTIQQPKSLSSSNGVLKLHHPHPNLNPNHHPHPYPHHHHQGVVVTYKECLKNHAASIGGHATDGCGEFMPSPNINPSEPTSLTCAACGCHRNFHRCEPEEPPCPPPPNTTPLLQYQPHHRHHPPPPPPPNNTTTGSHSTPSSPSSSPPPISASYYHPSAPPHMLLSLTNTQNSGKLSNPNGRKRFRTKFTQTQKEKMVEFAERIEWKFQKRDEEMINGFCNEVGIEKGVLKVWIHNNKNRKDQTFNNTTVSTGKGTGSGGAAVREDESSTGSYNHHHELQQLRLDSDYNGGGHVVATTTTNNGSGSSSLCN